MNKQTMKVDYAALLDVIRNQNAYIKVLEKRLEIITLGARAAIECINDKRMG